MIYNSDILQELDLNMTYLRLREEDNYEFSLMEISKMSPYRLDLVDLPPVMSKVRRLILGLGDCLDVREDDVVRLDSNMMDCVEIRFASRRDIKVNLYVENREIPIEGIAEPNSDEDEMYFTYMRDNRRMIMHGTMDKMIEELKIVLYEAQIP